MFHPTPSHGGNNKPYLSFNKYLRNCEITWNPRTKNVLDAVRKLIMTIKAAMHSAKTFTIHVFIAINVGFT